jgi:hypothetical protein
MAELHGVVVKEKNRVVVESYKERVGGERRFDRRSPRLSDMQEVYNPSPAQPRQRGHQSQKQETRDAVL